MKYGSLIGKSVRYALAAGAATALTVPAAVFAQNAPAAGTSAQPETAQLGKVEVTGTRILRTNVETAQPVTIVTQAQLKATGLTSIGEVISNLTQTGGYAENATFNNDNTLPTGRHTINLRFLGSNRLLVLVNGHRWISQPDGAVDMNTMPVAMVDHIEILQDGASAIYGSDAIAGVVNIITIKNFSGAEANAYLGMYDGSSDGGGWDGKAQEYDFTTGMSQGNAGAVLSVSYVNNAPISAGSRTISKEPVWGEGKFTGSSSTPDGRFRLQGPALAGQTLGQATCKPWDPANGLKGTCNMTLINPGQMNPTTSNFRNFTPTDYYNYAPSNYLLTPSERTGVYAAGHYDIADNLTFTSDVVYSNRHSQELLAPNLIGSSVPGPTSKAKGQGIGASNPYNPFGIDLVANLSQYCPTSNNAPGCSNEVVQSIGRREVEGGPRDFTNDVTTYMFRSGLNGFFNLAGNEYDWDVGYVYGNNKEIDHFQNSPVPGNNAAAALDSPGFTSCADTPACVPLNLFGGPPSITPAMLNFLTYKSTSTVESTIRDYTANITGTPINLPAGPLAVAAGLEYFENEMAQTPDSLSMASSGGTVVATAGKQRTNAEYVEFNIPLVADVPFVKNLSLDLANRWSQFRWDGGTLGDPAYGEQHFEHATTGRAALRWQTTTDLLLRGSWSQGFRAPSLSDLYAGLGGGTPTVQDPCAGPPNGSWNGSGPLPPGCNLTGGTVPHTQANAQIGTQTGGNPNLAPETSISKTVGFVYNPSWIPGFDISADFYAIQLQHEITTISPQAILNSCYISQNTGACSLIKMTRLGDSVGVIEDLNLNIGGIHTSGLDVAAHYRFPTTAIGDFRLGLTWTFLRSYVQTVPNSSSPSGFASTELAGTSFTSFSGYPKQRATLNAGWHYGNWSANWDMRYIHSMYEGCTDLSISMGFCSNPTDYFSPTGGTGRNHIGGTVYNDAAVTYHVGPWDTDFTFGARNLLDKQPPAALTAFANSMLNSFYGVPGRFFYARIGVKF